jgi:hypothetical protein
LRCAADGDYLTAPEDPAGGIMRILVITRAAIAILGSAGCSGELATRPPASDPTSVAAIEAPYHAPPSYEPDALLTPVACPQPAAKMSPHHPEHPAAAEPRGADQ